MNKIFRKYELLKANVIFKYFSNRDKCNNNNIK